MISLQQRQIRNHDFTHNSKFVSTTSNSWHSTGSDESKRESLFRGACHTMVLLRENVPFVSRTLEDLPFFEDLSFFGQLCARSFSSYPEKLSTG
jgi:hypothetical protein